jgi:6-phosphogluconolactonase
VANMGTNNVSAYRIHSGTGALTAVSGSPFAAGTTPTSVTVDPSGRFVYVANGGSNNISAFTINARTGALVAVSGSPFPDGGMDTTPVSVTVDPTGQFVYVVNNAAGSGSISTFTIEPGTGALTAVAGSPFGAGNVSSPGSMAVDPSGRFAYVTNQDMINSGYDMSAFAIGATMGALTFLNYSSSLGAGTDSVATDPLGQFIYTTQNVVSGLVAISFNSTTDEFSLPLNAKVCIVDATPVSITVDPSGTFVYVANLGANDITACAINQITGDLHNISGEAKVAAGTNPVSVATTGIIH